MEGPEDSGRATGPSVCVRTQMWVLASVQDCSNGPGRLATESEGSRHKAKFPSCVSFNLDCSYHRNALPMFRVILLQMTYLIKKILQKNAQELLC